MHAHLLDLGINRKLDLVASPSDSERHLLSCKKNTVLLTELGYLSCN